jgi:hypothetical protein
MAKKHLMDEELYEIMENSSYEEHLEDKEEENNKKNVQTEEELDDETEASALQRKKD